MARNASGTHSLPSGNPVVSGTTIDASWANTTMADFSTEITDSLSRSGKGAMLAPMEAVAGSISAPGVAFDAETALGFYRPSSNTLAFVQGAARKFSYDSTGVYVNPTSGDALFEIESADGEAEFRIISGDSTADEGAVAFVLTSDVLTFMVLDDDHSDGQTLFSVDLADDNAITFGRALDWSAGAATTRTNLGVAIGSDVQAYDADTAKLDEDQVWSGSQRATITDIDGDAGTAAIDFDASNDFDITMDDTNLTLSCSNLTEGQSGFITLHRDGGAAASVTYAAEMTFLDAGEPTFSSTADGDKHFFAYYIPNGGAIVVMVYLGDEVA